MSSYHLANMHEELASEPIRKGFGRGLKKAGEENENVSGQKAKEYLKSVLTPLMK